MPWTLSCIEMEGNECAGAGVDVNMNMNMYYHEPVIKA